tara:strand:- start:212 stop:508 length:297 start_codon:yes stop_codon:yes gene_type:complete
MAFGTISLPTLLICIGKSIAQTWFSLKVAPTLLVGAVMLRNGKSDGKLFLLKVDGYVSYKGRNPSIEPNQDPRWEGLHPELFQDKVPATLFELFGSEN